MKIKSIVAFLERIPLEQPYTIAYQEIVDTEIIYLIITLENGIEGFGAANPFAEVTGESPATALHHLQSDFIQQLVGREIEDYVAIIKESSLHFDHLPGTLAALDIALHDTYCKLYNKRVVDLYGQQIISLPTSITIGIKESKAMLEDAHQFYAKGFRILKVKTGINVEADIERVHYLSEAVGNKMRIRVDANAGYTLPQLKQFISATAQLNIELIEQPMPVGNEHLLAGLPFSTVEHLVADESLTDLITAKKLAQQPLPYGVFNIKLMKAGGLLAAKNIAEIAATQQIKLFWGCNDESIISIAAALHIAYACSNTRYLDLDGSFEVIEQLVSGGFEVIDGSMFIVGNSGLGIERKIK